MITEQQQVNKRHWNDDESAYVIRIDENTRRFIWFNGKGRAGHWIIQIMDNEGFQIGDAEYAANKRTLSSVL